MSRLGVIKNNSHMTTCLDCGFVYLAMSIQTEKNCPKCGQCIDEDKIYLANERKTKELVTNEQLFEDVK